MSNEPTTRQLIEEMSYNELAATIGQLREDVMRENQQLRDVLLQRDLLRAHLENVTETSKQQNELANKAQKEATYERQRANHAEDTLDNLLVMLDQHHATVNIMLDIIPDAVSEWADVRLAFTMWRALLAFQHSQVTQRFGSTDIPESDFDGSFSNVPF